MFKDKYLWVASTSGRVSTTLRSWSIIAWDDALVCLGVVFSCRSSSVFGALLAHYFTDGYGRRYTFVVAAAGFILGLLIMAMSPSYDLLLFGRTFVGLGVGIGLAVRVCRLPYRRRSPLRGCYSHVCSTLFVSALLNRLENRSTLCTLPRSPRRSIEADSSLSRKSRSMSASSWALPAVLFLHPLATAKNGA